MTLAGAVLPPEVSWCLGGQQGSGWKRTEATWQVESQMGDEGWLLQKEDIASSEPGVCFLFCFSNVENSS